MLFARASRKSHALLKAEAVKVVQYVCDIHCIQIKVNDQNNKSFTKMEKLLPKLAKKKA